MCGDKHLNLRIDVRNERITLWLLVNFTWKRMMRSDSTLNYEGTREYYIIICILRYSVFFWFT